ncbi:MAG: GTPase ObgE [Firmicutes bacterium]|nr:GTPase ObgE [Bacillota bacterium]
MQFVDRARIYVSAGAGGDGSVSFRREKYVPAGGPDGGRGGDGGSVFLEVDPAMSTLLDFRYKNQYKAERGGHGQGGNREGKSAPDLVIKVPPGTVVKDDETGEVLADLVRPNQRLLAARGGKGGRGNSAFATSTRRAPSFAEKGEPGEARWLRLELKVIADVGLVGYPNAGKSTLLSVISAARPKIAPYPFTTLSPNLGVVKVEAGKSFVVADIPGLIEGAHTGVGLGHDFLRHVERTRLLVHVVDCSGMEGRDPVDDYYQVREELSLFSRELAERPFIIVGNKLDIPGAEENLRRLEEAAGQEVVGISAATGQGVKELIYRIWRTLKQMPSPVQEDPAGEEVEVIEIPRSYRRLSDFAVRWEEDAFVVEGEGLELLMERHNLENPDTLRWWMMLLEDIGVIEALRNAGIKDGDTVRIAEWEFEYLS